MNIINYERESFRKNLVFWAEPDIGTSPCSSYLNKMRCGHLKVKKRRFTYPYGRIFDKDRYEGHFELIQGSKACVTHHDPPTRSLENPLLSFPSGFFLLS